ncbi:MAG: hypothetical protein IIU62_05580, partial [Alistipes sp.]|nr:hypothetical protein [Alistipes sp.]
MKQKLVSFFMRFWNLNAEAKLGILFLIPPILSVFMFILNFLFDVRCVFFDPPLGLEEVVTGICLYLGLMAIAGVYLIKGNLPINT